MNVEPTNPELRSQEEMVPQIQGSYRSITLTAGVILIVSVAVGSAVLGILNNVWQYLIVSGAFSIAGLIGLLELFKIWQTNPGSIGLPFIVAAEIAFVGSAVVLSPQVSLPLAIIALVLALIIGSMQLTGKNIENAIFIGFLAAIASSLFGSLNLVPQRYDLAVTQGLVIAAVILVAVFLILLLLRLIQASLRVKLMLGGLMLTLVPLVILSLISNQFTQNQIQAQSNQSLSVAANQTASAVDNFFSTNLDAIQTETDLPAIQRYLALPADHRSETVEETELASTFVSLQTKQQQYSPSYALLDPSGTDLYDTDRTFIGSSEAAADYFQHVKSTGLPYSTGVIFPANTRDAYLVFISPIRDVTNQTVGYLRSRFDALVLQTIIQSNVGLIGARSYPVLVDENGLRLADGYSPNLVYRTLIPLSTDTFQSLLQAQKLPSYLPRELTSTNQTDLASALDLASTGGYFTVTVSGDNGSHVDSATAVALQHHPWKLVFLQEQTKLIAARNAQNKLSTIIATIIAGIVGVLLTTISNSFTRPILQLTDTAEKISAGDLTSEAKVQSNDEIGLLGKTFNMMTRQLRQLVETLESRVQERTDQLARRNEALSYRSTQLQTVADVARNVVSIRDLETLLTSVTTLINERFNFYHVGIFLLDSNSEYAVLRAANSAGGRRMLARQHRLKVGQIGIVGYVTESGQPRIATDVGQDAVFFNNPDLPDTRSEMALPLKVENRVIGALDVQSIESNAFTPEDVDLFSTLADQIAVAISNNQLYEETRKALAEAQNLHRQYLNQEWSRRTSEPGNTSYKYTPDGLVPVNDFMPEIETVLNTSRPIFRSLAIPDDAAKRRSVMAVPINLRGETIGVIQLQEDRQEEYVWSENELATVQAVSDQVAQTLENTRLFEGTVRRAERERKVLEITSKIRSTNDPQQMLQITLEELKNNLGITDGQIIINLPGGRSEEPETRSLRSTALD